MSLIARCLIPFALVVSNLLAVPFARGQDDWLRLSSPPFEIFYLNPDNSNSHLVASLFETAYLDFAAKLNFKLQGTVSVFLCPTEAVFARLTGNSVPHWGEGVADPLNSLIILKSPALTGNHDRLPKLVRHELSHILIGQAISEPRLLPKWFNEGIAIYLSADEEFKPGKAISKALVSDSIIPLDEIDDVLKFQQAKARLAYEESYSFLNFLVKKNGVGAIAALLTELKRGVAWEEAFEYVFHDDIFDAELAWYDYIEKEYRWSFLVDFEMFLWIFILLLFILVVAAIRLRNRRTIKRWDEEERMAGF